MRSTPCARNCRSVSGRRCARRLLLMAESFASSAGRYVGVSMAWCSMPDTSFAVQQKNAVALFSCCRGAHTCRAASMYTISICKTIKEGLDLALLMHPGAWPLQAHSARFNLKQEQCRCASTTLAKACDLNVVSVSMTVFTTGIACCRLWALQA